MMSIYILLSRYDLDGYLLSEPKGMWISCPKFNRYSLLRLLLGFCYLFPFKALKSPTGPWF
ncbi:hypothetical protein HanPSC8_Chr12g0538071 [Helianthus annuus]|nr:hypothetical protein HanPSC8_Chr12g0538071 [Helianthus annuus]